MVQQSAQPPDRLQRRVRAADGAVRRHPHAGRLCHRRYHLHIGDQWMGPVRHRASGARSDRLCSEREGGGVTLFFRIFAALQNLFYRAVITDLLTRVGIHMTPQFVRKRSFTPHPTPPTSTATGIAATLPSLARSIRVLQVQLRRDTNDAQIRDEHQQSMVDCAGSTHLQLPLDTLAQRRCLKPTTRHCRRVRRTATRPSQSCRKVLFQLGSSARSGFFNPSRMAVKVSSPITSMHCGTEAHTNTQLGNACVHTCRPHPSHANDT